MLRYAIRFGVGPVHSWRSIGATGLPPARAVQIYDVKNNRQRNSLYDAEHTQELLKWSRTYLAKKGLTTERQLRVRALCSTDAFRGADASCAITGTNQRTSFT